MNRLVDIDELYKHGYECVTAFDEYGEPFNCELLDNISIVDAIVIPENPTNRDMIKAVFKGRDLSIITERLEHTKWLDAPYKKEG